MTPKQIIQKIKDDYSPLSNTEATLSSLANATKTLADDLYAKDTHFIFELIQNAEDNEYDKGVKPALRFRLIDNNDGNTAALVIYNNEKGFLPDHVKAVCAVGRSTKKKVEGYIGEKGIGFKSVFRITNCPEIHSAGFHFSLPEKHPTGLGYITPEWLNGDSMGYEPDWTTIALPLNKPEWPKKKIADALRDIEPETILFLNKLESLEIDIQDDVPYTIIVEKDSSEFPLVKLTYIKKTGAEETVSKKLYWCANKEFNKPSNINPEKRKDISKRVVSIAIPLSGSGHKGKLFAYLPVYEETGLPFLINSDFLLASSREGLKEDEPWNHWLRSCIAEVYTEGFLSCIRSETIPLDQKVVAYASIPLETRVSFLKPIIKEIQDHLKDAECILTTTPGHLKKPDLVKTASNDFRRIFAMDEDIPAYFQENICLTNGSVETYSNQLKVLGVKPISPQAIPDCLEDTDWVSRRPHDWLLDLYKYLQKQTQNLGKEKICKCKILPVSSYQEKAVRLSCDNEQPIYFCEAYDGQHPLDAMPAFIKKLVPIAFIDEKFQKFINQQENNSDLREWMCKTLNVYDFSIKNYRIDILNKVKNGETYKTLPDDELLKITEFLFEGEWAEDIEEFPVLLNDGEKIISDNSKRLLVPENYDPDTGWQHIWQTKTDRNSFLILSNRYSRSVIEKMIGQKILKKYPYDADDYNCQLPSFDGEKISKNTSESLRSWIKDCDSVSVLVANKLKNIAWLPVKHGNKDILCEPSKAFLGNAAIKEILGNDAPYFREGIFSHEIVTSLGIATEITYEKLLEVLGNYSGENSVSHKMIEKLYSELNHRTQSGNRGIFYYFQDKELIFIPNGKNSGRWCKLEDCLWKDCSAALGGDFFYLEKHYPKLRGFFIETLQIKENADPECYADRWIKLQSGHSAKGEDLEKILTDIYESIALIVETEEKPDWWGSFKRKAKIYTQSGTFEDKGNVFIDDDGEYKEIFEGKNIKYAWQPKNGPFSKWKLFYDAFENIAPLSECVEIELIKDIESDEPESPKFMTHEAIFMIASWMREREGYKTAYNSHLEKDTFKDLLGIKEVRINGPIRVRFSLTEGSGKVPYVERNHPVFWNKEENILVIANSEESNKKAFKKSISHHIAKQLVLRNPGDLSDWIELVLGESDTSRIKDKGWNVPQELLDLTKGTNSIKKDSAENEDINADEEDEESGSEIDDSSSPVSPHAPGKPSFPERSTSNPERRKERVADRYNESEDVAYEKKSRNVRVSSSVTDKKEWLKDLYTNDDGKMVCQMCEEEMPFKLRDSSEYYFEAVQIADKTFKHEDHTVCLALCPLCAAKYQQLLKKDNDAQEQFLDSISSTENAEHAIPLNLGNTESGSIKFVETHLCDLQAILEQHQSEKDDDYPLSKHQEG